MRMNYSFAAAAASISATRSPNPLWRALADAYDKNAE
jgi:hypothetical protein